MKLILFDVDGTLSASRQTMKPDMLETLVQLKNSGKYHLGIVGGSDRAKQLEQIGQENETLFDYLFSENGLVFYQQGKLVHQMDFIQFWGEEKYQDLVNAVLAYLSQMKLPFKRGCFVELRTGLLNICPVGRSVTLQERLQFAEYDKTHHIRANLVDHLRSLFGNELAFSAGGQISIDVFPKGWDKTFCLSLLDTSKYDTIYFFGDQTQQGGNDYEIFHHPQVIGQTVKNPEHTISLLQPFLKPEK